MELIIIDAIPGDEIIACPVCKIPVIVNLITGTVGHLNPVCKEFEALSNRLDKQHERECVKGNINTN
jgi:hypothetical protein